MFLFYYFLNLLSQILSVCCKEHKLCFTYFSYWGHQERIGHSLKNCPEDIIATAPQTHDLGSSLGEGVCCSLLDCLETYPPTLFWEILPLLMTPFLSEDLRKTQLVVEVLMQKASGATGSPHLGAHRPWKQLRPGWQGLYRERIHPPLTLTERVVGKTAMLGLLKRRKHLSSNSPSL